MTVAFAPGRANLIGEHTDYNRGLALPFAIERGITVRAEPRSDPQVVVYARDLDEHDEFDARIPQHTSGWRAYVRGVVAELGSNAGAKIEIGGDLPRGSGLSSSAALTVALALALGGERSPGRVAALCRQVENDWAGAHTGLLDQLAILLGRPDQAVRIDFDGLHWRHVPMRLGGWRLATLDSGAEHTHATSGYNERVAECRAAAERLGLESLRHATEEDSSRLPTPLADRVRHVAGENARVEQAVAALEAQDMEALAGLLDASHASLRDLYDASVPEIEATVLRAKAAGAAGARMMGGGFGGVVLALFPPGAEAPADALVVRPSAGARIGGS